MKSFKRASFVLLVASALAAVVAAGAAADTRQIPAGGTSARVTGSFIPSGIGDATDIEFLAEADSEGTPAPFTGTDLAGHGSAKLGPNSRNLDSFSSRAE